MRRALNRDGKGASVFIRTKGDCSKWLMSIQSGKCEWCRNSINVVNFGKLTFGN